MKEEVGYIESKKVCVPRSRPHPSFVRVHIRNVMSQEPPLNSFLVNYSSGSQVGTFLVEHLGKISVRKNIVL